MIRNFILLFLLSSNYLFSSSENYYLYVASESDAVVSLLKFDGKAIKEIERINVGIMATEIEGPRGITVDPSGDFWYLS